MNIKTGLTEKEVDEVICYNTYTCNLICDVGQDGKGHCTTMYDENDNPLISPASPVAGFILSGEICVETHSTD